MSGTEAAPIAPGRFTKITKGVRRELIDSGLPAESLVIVRNLMAEGCREAVVADTLGLSPAEWRALKKPGEDGEPSPLQQAIETGLGIGASEVIAVMRANMRAGDTKAAAWLGERVYKIGTEEGAKDTPRIQIVLNAPMELDAFRALGDVPEMPTPLLERSLSRA
mgnify:CR=1 FL=1